MRMRRLISAYVIPILVAAVWCGFWLSLLLGAQRSSQWSAVRAAHLEREPVCVACGRDRNLHVHHIIPIGVDPSLELVPSNLMTLCRRDHLTFGHFGDYRRYNPRAREHAEQYRKWKDEWERAIGEGEP